MSYDLRPVDVAVLRSISDQWETVIEIGHSVRLHGHDYSNAQVAGSLRRMRRLGLTLFRPGTDNGFQTGDWCSSEEGDRVAEETDAVPA